LNRFSIVGSLEQESWDRFVYEHPKGSIFHTSSMVEVFRVTKGYDPLFLAAIDPAGEVLALLIAVRIQTLPDPLGNLSSRSIFYAEPLCRADALGVEALTELIALHDAKMCNRVLFTEVRPLWPAGLEQTALERCGYEYKGYLNFVVDLQQPLEQLWGKLTKSGRKKIRQSHERGLQIEDATSDEGVNLLYHFLQLSYEHSGVPLADKSLFTAALKILHPRDMLKISVAYHEDTPVAAGVLLLYREMVYAWYGGLERVNGVSPFDCLTWHEIEWGRHHNYRLYDFGGAGWPDEPYGVRDFKAKFGGELVNYGRYHKVYSPWKLALAEKAYEWRRRIAYRHQN
jgi:lipid II:glycine glycyltransferase (peptidoglycan interpeptide bridge formation enzyme)